MGTKSPTEITLVLRRVYDAPLARVWRAWTDPAELKAWYVGAMEHEVGAVDVDVRPGGHHRVAFGMKGEEPYVESGDYREVVPMQRLSFEMAISRGGKVLSSSFVVVEFRDLGGKTEVTITDVGDDAWRHGEGWTPALERLARHIG